MKRAPLFSSDHEQQELRRIYRELMSQNMSKQDALEQIGRLKAAAVSRPEVAHAAALHALPVWERDDAATAGKHDFAEHHVIVCGLPQVAPAKLERMLPGSRCEEWRTLETQALAAGYAACAAACFKTLQRLLLDRPRAPLLVQLAVAEGGATALLSGLSGLLKSASLENPLFYGQLILAETAVTASELASQLRTSAARPQDSIIRYAAGSRWLQRWQAGPEPADPARVAFEEHGIYLISGGLGGVGRLFTREILRTGAHTRVIVTGRDALSAQKRALLAAFGTSSDRLDYLQMDVEQRESVERQMAVITAKYGRLHGILHCAGMLADNFIVKKTPAEFDAVLAPKVAGSVNLDEASRGLDLDFLALFSSFAGAFGSVGQADYAAANGFMDAYAAYRNQIVEATGAGGHTVSINWPWWAAGGMSIDPARLESLQRTSGVLPMGTDTGLRAFHRSLALAMPRLLVLEGDLPRCAEWLSTAARAVGALIGEPPVGAADLEARTLRYLCDLLCRVLKLPPDTLDPRTPLEHFGIDSIMAMALTDELEKNFGPLPKTLFFEYQSIAELMGYFVGSHAPTLRKVFDEARERARAAPGQAAAPAKPIASGRFLSRKDRQRPPAAPAVGGQRQATQAARPPEPIAIVGLSGAYPLARTLDQYWDNLRDGRDCVVEVPPERWNWREYYSEDRTQPGSHYGKWGGFIDGVDEFDPTFFNISPREAKQIDPQERLFLQHAWTAVEDAGYTRATLQTDGADGADSDVGVYVGVMYSEYQLFGVESSDPHSRVGVVGSLASIANRVSYCLNLRGPSIALDTMCSSSLTAIHLACQDLRSGRTGAAIAGGVNVSIHPNKYLVLSSGQFISSAGQCQSFGQGGDGYVPAEGVGAVVLKRLADAVRDGDHLYGVIRGSALSHGGRTNGFSVPSPRAQTKVIKRALADANIAPDRITYIEAHGTGTKLGDPIEIAALNAAFPRGQVPARCHIGSAKSNIGHAESAAGIAGLTKVLLQMRHRQIVPSLHSTKLNPNIDFENTRFEVNQTLRVWEARVVDGVRQPLMAGISSFGAGGSNAHLIVEEPPSVSRDEAAASDEHQPAVIVLSARTEQQLQLKIRDLREFVRTGLDSQSLPGLESLACTLQMGREAMDERVALVVTSAHELAEKLTALAGGETNGENIFRGNAKRNREMSSLFGDDADLKELVEKWIATRNVARLADLWVKGLEFDWERLYGATRPRRVSAPTYPFARERYWLDTVPSVRSPVADKAGALLHPLVHRNTSTLGQQSYSSNFTGDEPFLAVVPLAAPQSKSKVLAVESCLAMLRAALGLALPEVPDSAVFVVRDAEWGEPFVLDGERALHVALTDTDDGLTGYEIYSGEKGAEIVHGRGYARLDTIPVRSAVAVEQLCAQLRPGGLDSGKLHAVTGEGLESVQWGERQLLARLCVEAGSAAEPTAFALHPNWLSAVLQTGTALVTTTQRAAEPGWPASIRAMRILSAWKPGLRVWTRYAADPVSTDGCIDLDIDVFDEEGAVHVELRGVQYPAQERPQAGAQLDDHATEVGLLPLDTSFAMPSSPMAAAVGPVSLSNVLFGEDTTLLRAYSEGVYGLETPASAGGSPRSEIDALLRALETATRMPSLKVLVWVGGAENFLSFGLQSTDKALRLELLQAIAAFPHPLIAALPGGARGVSFTAAALCDFMVCSEQAPYHVEEADSAVADGDGDLAFLHARFGSVLAHDFVHLAAPVTGAQLRAKGWTFPIVAGALVRSRALELAAVLAAKRPQALQLLKHQLMRRLLPLIDEALPAAARSVAIEPAAGAAQGIEETESDGIVVLRIDAQPGRELPAVLQALAIAVGRAADAAHHRAVVLASSHAQFLPHQEGSEWEAALIECQRALLACPLPIVAAYETEAAGIAWLVGLLCDQCVYTQDARYCGEFTADVPGVAALFVTLFAHRLGDYLGQEILLTAGRYSGAELLRRAPTSCVQPRQDVLTTAISLARSMAAAPSAVVSARKAMAARIVRRTLESLPPLPPLAALAQMASGRPALVATSVALTGRVVSAVAHPEGILVVRMEDRRAKNMFSPELVSGLEEVFAHVAATPAYKVVVLSGFENYFASGGTRESLLAIQRGAAKFTDSTTFEAPLRCKVPVIAAMQGHGVGAGWVLGMLADFIIFSEESRYLSPYMDYGFTPGAGSTLVFPEKIGYDLARDTLLGALPYSGSDLRARGMGLPVEPQAQVQAAAMRLAQQLAQRPRAELIGLKQLFTHRLRQQLETTYASELTMHAATFVGREETLSLIRDRFVVADGVQREPATVSVDTDMPRAADSSATSVANGLKELLAAELQLSTERIGEDVQFIDLGLDSVSGVTWMRKINQRYGTSIEATKIYSHPTLRELGGYVSAQVGEERGLVRVPGVSVPVAAPSAVERVVARGAQRPLASRRAGRRSVERGVGVQSAAQPIAVIGLAGQFPGARDLQQYWENLAAGRDCVGEVPGERWDTGTYYRAGKAVAGKTNSRWLGALQEYDRFDPLFFNISPSEAQSMDPQQRLFLQTCWQGIEHAGYDARALSGSKCGVFVGCASGDYHQGSQRQRLSAQGFTGAANSILAARISYFLNLQGPCLAIDTACSSSLVAIANGCDSLRMGASDWVLAGGVYVMAGPEMHIRTAQAGMLSAQGRCFAFDQRADGFVPGEGVGVVVLKRLADAQRDGDTIYSVIRGWGVNQDGKTNGITAPNPAAQARLQQEVYERHGIDPGKIELLEAHGTGTQLGDPIEVQGLKESFGKYTRRQGYCALGSVKSNIGHCLTAAGVAGFIKLVLALRHRQLPPTIHFEKLNEHIELAGSPFYINSELREWHSSGDEPRQAAVSSFGFGGTNAHLVLQEHRAEPAVRWGAVRGEDAAMIVPLSARSAPQLRQRAADLLRFIQAPGQGVDLRELAYTLQVGRQAMEHRAAFTTPSLERLAAQLQDFLDGTTAAPGQENRDPLIESWMSGADTDWSPLYTESRPARVGLPGYPFAKERYWITNDRALPADDPDPIEAQTLPAAPDAVPQVGVDGQLLRERTTFKAQQLIGKVLELEPARINAHKELSAYGIDSLMIAALNEEFSAVFGSIPKTLFFEYRTLADLADYLADVYPGQCLAWTGLDVKREIPRPQAPAIVRRDRLEAAGTAVTDGREPIAIIGLSGLYPQTASLAGYWDNLRTGKDCITEIPSERWGLEGFFDANPMRAVERGKSYCKWGGFLDQFDQFDPLFFGISPREALSIDPQERIFLQAVWQALESAGYTRLELREKFDRKVGVFAGITKQGFALHRSADSRRLGHFNPHTSFSSLANRVSYFLDITGPSMPIDTMCSSSLTAIHEACEHIHRGECAMAFAGGVNLYLHPSTFVDMASLYALSRDGKCRSFGSAASGFVPGEGVGVVLLKPLAAAVADSDNIHGVILSTHVNHGGKTNGYTVPNPHAQAELIRGALQKAAISARAVTYIEAHGTGTELGDPIEMEGLRQAFGPYSEDVGYCRVGSAKSNIGHLEAAAGMAGLTKVLLQMKHKQLVPTLHVEQTNPNVFMDGSPFVLNKELTPWEPKDEAGNALPRIAGISAFGAGGANAHVIVQEYNRPTATRSSHVPEGDPVIVPLSAHTAEQLKHAAAALLEHCSGGRTQSGDLDLLSVAYTLQSGREPMGERLALVVESIEQLCTNLTRYVKDGKLAPDTFRGRAGVMENDLSVMNQDDDIREAIARWIARRKVRKLAELWVNGLSIDWRELYSDPRPQRADLPTYSFSAERFWLDSKEARPRDSEPLARTRSTGSVENILDQLDGDGLELDQAADLLRRIV